MEVFHLFNDDEENLFAFGFKTLNNCSNGAAHLIATAVDSRNDVIATVAVVVGMILSYKYQINVDGFIGLVVSLFIVWSGIGLCKETASPLIGERPDPVLVDEIAKIILSHEDVIGIHDLMVHNYGAGKIFASAHIEVDASRDVMDNHKLAPGGALTRTSS